MTRPDLLRSFRAGRPVVLIDEDAPEGGADLVICASTVTPAAMAFLVRHTCGYVTVALPALRCDALNLPATAAAPDAGTRPVPAVAVDAQWGASTGISAADRTRTARLLADPRSTASEFTRPGHLVPLRVPPRATGAIAATFDLCHEAGMELAVVRCELVRDDGPLLAACEGFDFAAAHGLALASTRDLFSAPALVRVA